MWYRSVTKRDVVLVVCVVVFLLCLTIMYASWPLVLSYNVYSKQPILGLTQLPEWFRELSSSRLECGVHDKLHIYPLCRIFYFTCHRHQIEGKKVKVVFI